MTKTLLFCSLFMLSILGYSQQVMITGKVVIDNTDEVLDLQTILIFNQQSGSKSKASQNGIFSIRVSVNDVLEISGNYVEKREIKISENIIKKGFVEIHLDIETIELAEANINPLKKNLTDNISKEKSHQEKMFEIIGFDEEFKLDMIKGMFAAKYLKKNGGVVSYENILKLKDNFKDKAKNYVPEIREEKKGVVRMNEIISIREFFTDNYFTNKLNIPRSKIIDFISYSYEINDFKKLYQLEDYDQISFFFEEDASVFLQLLNQK